MTITECDSPEIQRAYFDNNLRSCLVDVVAACLQYKPGSDPKVPSVTQYAEGMLDPFFGRLAQACLDARPDDLVGFMLSWVLKQKGPEPEALRQFVAKWLESYTITDTRRLKPWSDEAVGADSRTSQSKNSELEGSEGCRTSQSKNSELEGSENLVQDLRDLQTKHTGLVDALCSTGLGMCMMQKLAEGPHSLDELGLPTNGADVESLKLVQQRLDEKDVVIATLNAHINTVQKEMQEKDEQYHQREEALNAHIITVQKEMQEKDEQYHQREEILQEQITAMQVELDKLQKENAELQSKVSQQTALPQLGRKSVKDDGGYSSTSPPDAKGYPPNDVQEPVSNNDQALPLEPPKPPGRSTMACVNLILKTLMDHPEFKVSSAAQAWAFFEPDETNQVDRNRFRSKVSTLDILTEDEISYLLEFIDYHGSGCIDYDEWKAALMLALAESGDLHALPSEEEFNAIMSRIKAKLEAKGISATEAFNSCDFDDSKQLSHDEFEQGMLQLKLGLSRKEVTQMFFAMDADRGGTIDLEEFEEAIEEGAEADTLKAVARPIFRKVGEAFIETYCTQVCQMRATPLGSEMMNFDGFVELVRIGHPEMTLSAIMRLWCIVDKCGQGGVGFASIPDLVSNVLAATSTMSSSSRVKKAGFASAVEEVVALANLSADSPSNLGKTQDCLEPKKVLEPGKILNS